VLSMCCDEKGRFDDVEGLVDGRVDGRVDGWVDVTGKGLVEGTAEEGVVFEVDIIRVMGCLVFVVRVIVSICMYICCDML
jgi:hypothetical protein